MKKILIVAGETSGDLHGANLVKALLEKDKDLRVIGLGGPRMQEAGVELLTDLTQYATAGLDPLRYFNKFTQIFRQLVGRTKKERPDLVVLIDFPDFNLRFARQVKLLKIPIVYYISPQVWAWRRSRIKTIARLVDKMLVIFEFEKELYERHKVPVEFVGHPLMDIIGEARSERREVRSQLRIKQDGLVIGFLPGSRVSEFRRHLPIMLQSAQLIQIGKPVFLLACAANIPTQLVQQLTSNVPIQPHIYHDRTYEVMQASDLLITSSGTATLEAGIFATPMIVMYKVSLLTACLFGPLIKTPYYAMINIVAGKKVVPELIQRAARPENIASEVIRMIRENRLPEIAQELRQVRDRLGPPGASHHAAEEILKLV